MSQLANWGLGGLRKGHMSGQGCGGNTERKRDKAPWPQSQKASDIIAAMVKVGQTTQWRVCSCIHIQRDLKHPCKHNTAACKLYWPCQLNTGFKYKQNKDMRIIPLNINRLCFFLPLHVSDNVILFEEQQFWLLRKPWLLLWKPAQWHHAEGLDVSSPAELDGGREGGRWGEVGHLLEAIPTNGWVWFTEMDRDISSSHHTGLEK